MSASLSTTACTPAGAAEALAQVRAFAQALAHLRQQPQHVHAFALHWRGSVDAALAALPARFTEVWHNLLDRLESSALFAEESCSFSHADLLDSLQMWADKAQEQLC
jgi:hypothetical protein